MKKLLLLLLISCNVFAQDYPPKLGPGRPFLSPNLPASPPSKFGANDHLFVISDSTYYQWVNNAWTYDYLNLSKRGAKGDPGPQGIPGIPGQSITGPAGSAGANGQAATITIGTTTTLPAGSNATVTNTGTSSNAVLNFGIPQGAQGTPGSGGGGLPTVAGTVRYCYNETDVRSAISGIVNNTVRKIELMQEISITSNLGPFKLPNTDAISPDIIIEIAHNGNGVFDRTATGLPAIWTMDITDQSMCINSTGGLANRPRSYHFHDGKVVGKKINGVIVTGIGIDISCCQGSTVNSFRFENMQKGLRVRFCMFADIYDITSADISQIVIEPTRGDWPGSGNNLCSSNQVHIRNVRASVMDGSIAIIYSKACSGHTYELITGENGYAEYGIYWDYNGANEVKNGPYIKLCHWEGDNAAQFSKAFIYIRQGGGSTTVIEGTNHQLFANTRSPLIWVQGEGSGNTVKVNDLRWLLNDSKFQSTGQNFWVFNDCYDGANLLSQSRWVGTIPNGISTYNNGTSQLTVKRP